MDRRKEKLRKRLEAAQAEFLALVDSLDEAEAERPTANPGWTVKDVVAHVASAELGHRRVIRALLAGQPIEQTGFDLDAFNEAEVGLRRDKTLAELRAELIANRAECLLLLDGVTPEDWERSGRHPGGFEATVEGVFRVIAIHQKRHLKEIKAALAN